MKKTLLALTLLAIFVAALLWALPDSIDNDLTQIGNGNKSVVFIYDLNRVVSNQQTIEMNEAKAILANSGQPTKLNFLVARVAYPETDKLLEAYNAQSAELLFFDEGGALYTREYALVSAQGILDIMIK